LTLQGETLEAVVTPEQEGPFWQMRIPLPDSQYVNLVRGAVDQQMSHVAVGGFAETIGRGLTLKLQGWTTEPRQGYVSPAPCSNRTTVARQAG
jgi:hypothetical protein